VDEGAGVRVLEEPEGAVGGLFDVADAFADGGAFGGFGAAFAVEGDAVVGAMTGGR
jgi:hypothetical protein